MLRNLDVTPALGPGEAHGPFPVPTWEFFVLEGKEQQQEDARSSPPSRESLPRNAEGLVPLEETNAAIL